MSGLWWLWLLGCAVFVVGLVLTCFGIRERRRDWMAYAGTSVLMAAGASTCVCAVLVARS